MAETDDAWTEDSNKALEISLVVPSEKGQGLATLTRFNPSFTYTIFGNEERIFGYQGLKINLRFHASDMRPLLEITHSKKFRSIGDTQPTDVAGLMRESLPQVAFAKSRDFEAAIRSLPSDWVPPGELLTEFGAKNGGTFEIRRGSLADPAVTQLASRTQVLVPLFIEGGRCIITDPAQIQDETLDRWELFCLYYKLPASSSTDTPAYQFAGFSTVYKFFPLPRHAITSSLPVQDSLDLPSEPLPLANLQRRNRISQFVVLPPYQNSGNGARLYHAIYKHYLRDPKIIEVTVEDPNEAFDDMRDVADLTFLRTTPEFNALRINLDIAIPKRGASPRNIVDDDVAESTRVMYKIAPRQFSRVLEMHLMSKLAESLRPSLTDKAPAKSTKAQEHEYDLWRVFVKQRLYRHNKDILSQLDRSERIDKLNETLGSVELEYARVLALAERRKVVEAEGSKGKRKLEENNTDTSSTGSKKARVEDVEDSMT